VRSRGRLSPPSRAASSAAVLKVENGAIDFSAGQAERLAGLSHDELGEALLLLNEGTGNVFQDFPALPARQGAGTAEAGYGVIDGPAVRRRRVAMV